MSQLQNLLHDALIATEHVQQCAIVRRKDCLVRAASVGFNVGFKFSPAPPHPPSLSVFAVVFNTGSTGCVCMYVHACMQVCVSLCLCLICLCLSVCLSLFLCPKSALCLLVGQFVGS